MILLATLMLHSKGLDCKHMLNKSISDLNHANSSSRIDRITMFSSRSLANYNMYQLCMEVNDSYRTKDIIRSLINVKGNNENK